MKLSVVIPCYNEVDTIEKIIEAVNACPVQDKEIILVDDYSTDGTREKLRNHLEKHVNKVLYHECNRGKGAAIRTGVGAATGDIVIVQDADLEYDPNEIPKVIAPILDGRADVVYGSRFLAVSPHEVTGYWHMLVNKFLTAVSNMFTNISLTDMETCYKAFRRQVIQSIEIEENRFGFEPEITAKVARGNNRIYEVGISYHGRSYSQGKKIGWKDGLSAIRCIIKYNLFCRNKPPTRRD
jgi:glycosyltransferase involved in cell wall biosynthesis